MKNIEDLTYGQLINYTKGLERQVEDLKHINSELEYRLKKLNIQIITDVEEYKDNLGLINGYVETKIIPEIKYCEFIKFKSEAEEYE